MLDAIQSDHNLLGEAIGAVLLLGLAALALLGMRRGFRRRAAQAGAAFGAVPSATAPAREADGAALYTGTTVAGSRMERVALPELWGRWRCVWWVQDGALLLARPDGRALRLDGIVEAALVGAHAGRAVGRRRIAVVRWTLGGEQVDTGLQFAGTEEAEQFVNRLGSNGAAA